MNIREKIRKRPAMYLGSNNSKGIVNLLKLLISESLELIDPKICDINLIILSELEFQLEISSDCEFEQFENKNNYFEVCEALSKKFEFEMIEKKLNLRFFLDDSIIKEDVDYFELLDALLLLARLNRNVRINLQDRRTKNINQNYLYFPQGIKYYYHKMIKGTRNRVEFDIFFDEEVNGIKYEIFLGYRKWYGVSSIKLFANNERNRIGSLLDGIMQGLIAASKEYQKLNNLTDYEVKKRQLDYGLIIVASAKGKEFEFEGSLKDKLKCKKVQKDVSKIIKELTLDFMNKNPENAMDFFFLFRKYD